MRSKYSAGSSSHRERARSSSLTDDSQCRTTGHLARESHSNPKSGVCTMRNYLYCLLIGTLVLTVACGPSKSGSSNGNGMAAANGNNIIGAGSTFVYPVMTKWISSYQQNHPGVRINYQSIGSGGAIQQLKNKLVDFGASDAALDDEQLKQMPSEIIQLAESAGPVCITYNLPKLSKPLQLSDATLAGIFLGKIKNWSDPAFKKDNPGISLPNTPIVVA